MPPIWPFSPALYSRWPPICPSGPIRNHRQRTPSWLSSQEATVFITGPQHLWQLRLLCRFVFMIMILWLISTSCSRKWASREGFPSVRMLSTFPPKPSYNLGRYWCSVNICSNVEWIHRYFKNVRLLTTNKSSDSLKLCDHSQGLKFSELNFLVWNNGVIVELIFEGSCQN